MPRSLSHSKGAVMPGNDFSGIGDKGFTKDARSKSPTIDLNSSPAGFDLSNKNPNAKGKEKSPEGSHTMKKNNTSPLTNMK